LIAIVLLAWPSIRSILPDPTGAARDKAQAVEAQAALTEFMKRIDVEQRNIQERVNNEQSVMDRLTDRASMARTQDDKDTLQHQISDAQRELAVARDAQQIASARLFSVDALASLQAKQALGESELRDGHISDAAAALSQTRDTAKQILDSAGNLEPAILARDKLKPLLSLAQQTVTTNGGNAQVLLAQPIQDAAAALDALQNGDSMRALTRYSAAGTELEQSMHKFLEYMVAQYAAIAQKKMTANDLDVAQEAIDRGKALQALEERFR
jgi:hypothetical protein